MKLNTHNPKVPVNSFYKYRNISIWKFSPGGRRQSAIFQAAASGIRGCASFLAFHSPVGVPGRRPSHFRVLHLLPDAVHLLERGILELAAGVTEALLDGAEPALELRDRPPQRFLGTEAQEASDVDKGEQQVPHLFLYAAALALAGF